METVHDLVGNFGHGLSKIIFLKDLELFADRVIQEIDIEEKEKKRR